MPDREKVISGLKYCTHTDGTECPNCPYWHDDDCVETLNADALALLKEQDDCENCAIAIEYRQPVVRCKDCKHGQYEEWDNGECVDKTVYCDGYGIHKPDWFCADGKQKD